MVPQLRLDGTLRELKVDILLDGWNKYREQSERDHAGMYSVWPGEYDSDTDTITINLDVLLECFTDAWESFYSKPEQCDLFIWKLTKTITHEYIHQILNNTVSEKACRDLDKIAEREPEICG